MPAWPVSCQYGEAQRHSWSENPVQRDELLHLLLDRRAALLGYIATILADRASGEDVFQDTLIRASDLAAQFEHPGQALVWVRTTARNLALNETRKAHRRSVSLDNDVLNLLDAEWPQTDRLTDREDLDQLGRCLDRLAPFARTLIRLRFAEELSGEVIANRVGKTLSVVQTSLSRTYKVLAECMHAARPA